MLAQRSGKGTEKLRNLPNIFTNVVTAKLDDVTKILTDLKTDLDTPKLTSQRTPLFLTHDSTTGSMLL